LWDRFGDPPRGYTQPQNDSVGCLVEGSQARYVVASPTFTSSTEQNERKKLRGRYGDELHDCVPPLHHRKDHQPTSSPCGAYTRQALTGSTEQSSESQSARKALQLHRNLQKAEGARYVAGSAHLSLGRHAQWIPETRVRKAAKKRGGRYATRD